MKKIEIIWRELLYQAIENRNRRFTQKELAYKFGFSTSTVFQALKTPRKMGAVRVTGRYFVLEDPEKLLYHWASFRHLWKDVVYSSRVDLPISEIEGRMPPSTVFACFSAARQILNSAPADYDKVFVYLTQKTADEKEKSQLLKEFKNRFPQIKGSPNLFVLRGDSWLQNYGTKTTLGQTFVDLWNLNDWYAKDFLNNLRDKLML